MCMSGDPGSGKWLFISLFPRCTWKCHHLFGFRGVLGAIIERCGDALWCEVHTALIIPRSSANKHGMSLDLLCLSLSFFFFCTSLIYCYISLYLLLFVLSSGDMLDLLKWRAHPERINDSLSKLKEIDGSEIVKVGPVLSTDLIVFWFGFSPRVFRVPTERIQTSLLFFSLPQFLQDTLDTLFGILDESSQRYGLKVFDSLVS